MPKTPSLTEEENAVALHTYDLNREQLIQFHEQLAGLGAETRIPPSSQAGEPEAMDEFREIKSVLDSSIARLAKQKLKAGKQLDFEIARLSFLLYLYDRINRMQPMALQKNRLPLYALFATARRGVLDLARQGYFKKTNREIIESYLPIEPVFVACQRACGLQPLGMAEAVVEYKHELRRQVIQKMVEG